VQRVTLPAKIVIIIIKHMVDSSQRTVIAFGLTGAGKSFMLNLLMGIADPDNEDDQYFRCSPEASSVTKSITEGIGKVGGDNSKRLKLIDMPGMKDTEGGGNDLLAIKKL